MRRRVKWVNVLAKLDNSDMYDYFFSLISKLRKGKTMSCNRAAYYTLKHFYSTTTIDALCGKLGI